MFALIGVATEGRQRWRALSPIFLLVGFLTAVHMVTIGSIRYRLPLEPFLLVIAARAAANLSARASPADRALARLLA
jgi:hypothetical protein